MRENVPKSEMRSNDPLMFAIIKKEFEDVKLNYKCFA